MSGPSREQAASHALARSLLLALAPVRSMSITATCCERFRAIGSGQQAQQE